MSQPELILTITDVLPELRQFLDQLQSGLRRLDDPGKSAVRAVWRAVDQTRLYLGSIDFPDGTVDEANPELVQLWSDAALAIAEVDHELARRLRMKAEYWSDPRSWRGKPGIDISIDSVAHAARELLPRSTRPPSAGFAKKTEVAGKNKIAKVKSDVFISHASEDKEDVARPIANQLLRHNYTVWLDQYMLRLGDSLRRRIDDGLGSCRYGVVVLSPQFFQKKWPQLELDALVALETADGHKRILPVWHNVDRATVAQHSPMLASRLAVSTTLGMETVGSMIIDVLEGEVGRLPLRNREA